MKMLTIRDLTEQFEMQGEYQLATYDYETDERIVLAEGFNFLKIKDNYLDADIRYMFADDNKLVIEIDLDMSL
jgi:hypothetical protein